jgi:hypothetical protein
LLKEVPGGLRRTGEALPAGGTVRPGVKLPAAKLLISNVCAHSTWGVFERATLLFSRLPFTTGLFRIVSFTLSCSVAGLESFGAVVFFFTEG